MAKKFKGKALSLLVDGKEFNDEGTSVILDNEDGDDDALVFAEVEAGGGVVWFFTLNGVSDYASTSFWSLLWDNVGEEIAFIFKPYGNATPSPAQPHFTGTVKITKKPPVGGQAGSTFTYEARLDVEGEPSKVTA